MNEPSKEPTRSMSWRPLLLSSGRLRRFDLKIGGPRRIIKSYPDNENQEQSVSKQIPSSLNRLEKGNLSLKRPYSSVGTGIDSLPPALAEKKTNNSPPIVPMQRNSLEKETRRLSSFSSRSSYSEDRSMERRVSAQEPITAKRETMLPKNLQDVINVVYNHSIKID